MAKEKLKRCVIVCASPDADADFIKSAINVEDYIIAADGGMLPLGKAGIIPDLFVGDFDSFEGSISEDIEVIKLNTRKDDTDSMHCAEVAVKRGFKEICLLGASGGSLPHTFSNFSVLSYLCDKGIKAYMSDPEGDVRIFSAGTYKFSNLNGCGFSVFPFGCRSAEVSYIGDVEYPAEKLTLYENSSLGKSNVFRSDYVEITVHNGKVIIFNSKSEI